MDDVTPGTYVVPKHAALVLPPTTSYQPHLAAFVVEHKLLNLVETGLGVSTLYLLDALDKLGAGHLTSIDPAPWSNAGVSHPRLTWMQMRALDGLELLPKMNLGPLDLYLHDGAHTCWSQTFEFHWAWGMLRRGGWLACDDWSWAGHDAWKRFVAEPYHLKETKLDSLQMVQKNDEPVAPTAWPQHFHWCGLLADCAERDWFARGGKNEDYFVKDHD